MAAAAVATDASPAPAPVDRTPSDWHFVGSVAPGYEAVEKVFKDNFLEGEEVGAGLCCYVDGVKVLDIEGGYKVRPGTRHARDGFRDAEELMNPFIRSCISFK